MIGHKVEIVEAAVEGNLAKVKRLVEEEGLEVVHSLDGGFTALHLAACCGHLEVNMSVTTIARFGTPLMA